MDTDRHKDKEKDIKSEEGRKRGVGEGGRTREEEMREETE